MLLAVFSDIHANLPALEAVMKDIRKHHPDLIYCLGDLVNQNVWNSEVIQMIQADNIPCIMGNHDQGIGNGRTDFRFSYSMREEEKWGKEAIAYTLSQLTDKEKSFLSSLPLHLYFNFDSADGPFNLLMAHGSPTDMNEYIYYLTSEDKLRIMLENAGTHTLLMGHTHHPYHQVLQREQDGKKIYLHAINAGSVGCPKDGNWHSSYVLIEWEAKDNLLTDPDAMKVSIRRIDYDIDTVIHAIQKSPLPIFYAGRLIK